MKASRIIVAFAALLAAGCTVEENIGNPAVTKQELTIHATREDDGVGTKTVRKDDGTVWWVPGDALSMFFISGTDGGNRFESCATDTVKVTDFTGTINIISGGCEQFPDGNYLWGLYPYSADASCDGTGVTMTLPSAQTAQPGTFASGAFPSIGRSRGLNMAFYNICSGLKFTVTKAGVKKVTLKSRNGESVTGRAKISFDEDERPSAEILDGSDEVSLTAPEGETFEVGTPYFIVFYPATFADGFTMTLETLSETATYEKTDRIVAKRSVFGNISDIDAGLTYSAKSGNIPIEDDYFKEYLVENFDTDTDGEISYAEAGEITQISVSTDSISSVKGIECMPKLNSLSVSGSSWNSTTGGSGKLTALDVSKNTALRYLYCFYNQLTSLDVSKNTALRSLLCEKNQLTSLDVSKNTALTSLNCNFNQLTSLDVSKNTALTQLSCYDNQLTSLDVSKNTALRSLLCERNQLTSLDVSKNTALTVLDCSSNQLTSLDVSKNTALTSLYCNSNQLTSLDVSKNTALTRLYCYSNQLTSLDVSKNTALTDLYCTSNQLTSLDVSKNTSLASLNCYSNQLTSLDVSKNTALTDLDCSPMNDASGNNLLSKLFIYEGQIIPRVTVNRNASYIPIGTLIIVKQDGYTVYGVCDNITHWNDFPETAVALLTESSIDLSGLSFTIDCSVDNSRLTLFVPAAMAPPGTLSILETNGQSTFGTIKMNKITASPILHDGDDYHIYQGNIVFNSGMSMRIQFDKQYIMFAVMEPEDLTEFPDNPVIVTSPNSNFSGAEFVVTTDEDGDYLNLFVPAGTTLPSLYMPLKLDYVDLYKTGTTTHDGVDYDIYVANDYGASTRSIWVSGETINFKFN